MNERIRQLAEQALTACVDENGFYGKDKQLRINPAALADTEVFRVFAKLIVDECCAWTKDNGGITDNEDIAALKEHFGVTS